MKFNSCHPIIYFVYFAAVTCFAVLFNHPVYMAITFIAAFILFSGLYGKKALSWLAAFFLFSVFFTIYYASFNHFGVTSLWKNKIGNNITWEAILYGFLISVKIIMLVMIFACFIKMMPADKIIFLVGRCFPKLSLFITIFFREFDVLKNISENVNLARSGIGKGKKQGGLLSGIKNRKQILSVAFTCMTENYFEASMSMRCRGYTLKKRTSFSIYSFDNRDRIMFILLSFGIIMTVMAHSLGITDAFYNPVISIGITLPYYYIYYIIYGLLCMMPVIFNIICMLRYRMQSEFR